MRFALVVLAAVSAMSLSGGAAAQQAGDATVESYLCTFAGKCGADVAAPSATRAAPDTKGFRLAAPQATSNAAATRTTESSRPASPRPQVAAAQSTARAPRRMAAVTRRVVAGTRADLMLAFEYNSDRMTSIAQGKAKTFAQALLTPELMHKRFLIAGHTDSRGSREFNVDLSRRRAQSVADFLAAQGVDLARVEVKGVGPDEPLPGRSPGADANRRVEAVLLS